MEPKFYGINIDFPQSAYHYTPGWQFSNIGRMNLDTGGKIYLEEIPYQYRDAEYCWRVVDGYFSDEDEQIARFHAHNVEGEYIAEAVFGISFNGYEKNIPTGQFKYPPQSTNMYVPVVNAFPTFNKGGYRVQVLDLENPSEVMYFGITTPSEGAHSPPIFRFRLMKLGENYPNDYEVQK